MPILKTLGVTSDTIWTKLVQAESISTSVCATSCWTAPTFCPNGVRPTGNTEGQHLW